CPATSVGGTLLRDFAQGGSADAFDLSPAFRNCLRTHSTVEPRIDGWLGVIAGYRHQPVSAVELCDALVFAARRKSRNRIREWIGTLGQGVAIRLGRIAAALGSLRV